MRDGLDTILLDIRINSALALFLYDPPNPRTQSDLLDEPIQLPDDLLGPPDRERRDEEHALGLVDEADRLDKAIANVLASGTRTKDIAGPGMNAVGTQDVGDAIVKELEALA